MYQFDIVRQQMLDAVPVNGVRVSAAHLHELEVLGAATRQVLYRSQQLAGRRRVAEFVNEFHFCPLQPMADVSKASISVV